MILVLAGVLLIVAAGIGAAALSRWPAWSSGVFRLLLVAGCVAGMAGAVPALVGAPVREVGFTAGVPGGTWVFGVDGLSAVFLVVILGVGAASALYGVTYLGRDGNRRTVAMMHLLVAVLVAAMALVVAARAAVPFLMAWEVMAVSAWLLIVYEREREEVRRAGLLYLIATHTGTLALFALFAVWGGDGRDLTFASLAARIPLTDGGAGWIIALALFGFGIKAGLVPLHFWLPAAHGAAPSHVSALLSGVLIKMGIYGLMRVIALLGAPPAWWGWLLLTLGAVSGVLGVIWALAQHDLKHLLAYHSVENIGIILLGLGAGVLGTAYGHPQVAVLGFAGAALHTVNHALFKSLLFLGAGSVLHGAGTREIERLGGLARRMPATFAGFLIGSAAIVGLPPLNGFLSEWLVFRSLLASGEAADSIRLAVLGAAVLALIGALALACFAKVVGIVFLGSPRDAGSAQAHESPRGMVRPMLGLAGACAAIGLAPVLVLPPVLRVGAQLAGVTPSPSLAADAAAVPLTVLALSLALVSVALFAGSSRVLRRRPRASSGTWGCGYDAPTPRMQYTASSFGAPILLAFGPVAGVTITRTADAFATHPADPVLDGMVFRSWRGVRVLADRLRPIQRGRLSLYLLYIVATVIALLVYLLLAGHAP